MTELSSIGLKVRNFITKYTNMSRVTIDRDSYGVLSRSGRALASRGKVLPELTPAGTSRDKDGNFYNRFVVDGHTVFYRFDKFATVDENPHIFLMNTEEAESIHEPMDTAYDTLDVGTEISE